MVHWAVIKDMMLFRNHQMEDDNVHDAENPVLVCLVTDVVDDNNDINNFYVGGDFDGDGDIDLRHWWNLQAMHLLLIL